MAEPIDPATAALYEYLGLGDDGKKQPKTREETFAPKPFNWEDAIISGLQRDIRAAAKDAGYNQDLADGIVSQFQMGVVRHLDDWLSRMEQTGPMTAGQYDWLLSEAKLFISSKSDIGRYFFNLAEQKPDGPGTRKPTAQEIRQSFDLDELTNAVSNMYRGLLLDDAADPRAIARAYIEAIVSNPDQKLDFDTYVEGYIDKEPRAAAIYRNKPDSMSKAQFLQPYMQSAQQVLRPGNAAEAARAGAQLGSSPDAFREKLGRSREAQVSSPFITGMENKITQLGNLFKTQ